MVLFLSSAIAVDEMSKVETRQRDRICGYSGVRIGLWIKRLSLQAKQDV